MRAKKKHNRVGGGNGTAHLHTPTHSVEKEGDALHNAHPLHTPNGSSREEPPVSFAAKPGEDITVEQLRDRQEQEAGDDWGEI